jgi:hypothetical protein
MVSQENTNCEHQGQVEDQRQAPDKDRLNPVNILDQTVGGRTAATEPGTMLWKNVFEALLQCDRHTGGHPILPAGSRELVQEMLTRMLVDRRALNDHVHTMQKYFHDARAKGQMTTWHHDADLDEEVEQLVIRKGSDAFKELEENAVASLLLNYAALFDLSDQIATRLPNAWINRLAAHGQQLLKERGVDVGKLIDSVIAARKEGVSPEKWADTFNESVQGQLERNPSREEV